MKKEFFKRIGEKGSLMVEAMAMLGLISMVTPILYKKAAERTSEMQDINAANEMRSINKALDDYLRDNYDDIINGRTVTRETSKPEFEDVSYAGFEGTTEKHQDIAVEHIEEYLPYGFLEEGESTGSRIFSGYELVVKKTESAAGDNRKTLTGFVVATPNEGKKFPLTRASRIASMVGSNGGFVLSEGKVNGVQGIWGIDDTDAELGMAGVEPSTVVTASMFPISSGNGAAGDEVLYRVAKANPELNTMRTAINMGNNSIKEINQLIVTAQGSDFGAGTDATSALLIENGGAEIAGRISAVGGAFEVDENGLTYSGTGVLIQADDAGVSFMDDKVTITPDGDVEADGSLNVAGDATIGGNLEVTGTSKLKGDTVVGDGVAESGYKLTVRGNAYIDGILTLLQLKAKEADFGKMRAGLDPDNLLTATDADYSIVVDKDSVTIKSPTTINNTVVVNSEDGSVENFAVDAATGYTYARGLLAGNKYSAATAHADRYPLEISNEPDNVDIEMRLANQSNWAKIYDYNDNTVFQVGDSEGRLYYVGADGKTSGFQATDTSVKLLFRNDYDVEGNEALVITQATAPNDTAYDMTLGDASTLKVMRNRSGTQDNIFMVDSDGKYKNQNYITGASNADGKSSVYVGKGMLEVGDQTVNDTAPVFKVSGFNPVSGEPKGTVNIRKGVVQIASNQSSDVLHVEPDLNTGYLQTDRIVANRKLEPDAIPIGQTPSSSSIDPVGSVYDAYQINPAYTSVMHDIKLTSRGGARLSDVLSDFVNKGIYVVDNTYQEGIGNWESFNPSGGEIAGKSECSAHGNCNTSAWLGFVPKASCPPGYANVITMTPAGFSMSQAGTPDRGPGGDILPHRNPFKYFDAVDAAQAPDPLYFQKNTWLKSKVYTHGLSGSNFQGWSTVMGFIYPAVYFLNYIERANINVGSITNETVAWNLFPVYRKELEAYATVYCYFDRLSNKFDSEYVDKYDQLNAFRGGHGTKPTSYQNRLNDPKIKNGSDNFYNDPW